jgi:hypothetical protein
MSSDDQLERQVERWLAETARPMPPELLDDVLLELPRTRRRSLAPAGIPWRARRPVLAVAIAAVLIVAIGVVGSAFPFLQRPLPAGIGESLAPAGLVRTWDPAADFRVGSLAANPSDDAYGNSGVWAYLYGPSIARDPGGYALMPSFNESLDQWWVPGFRTLNIYPTPDRTALVLHSFRTGNEGVRTAILRWTSPVAARVRVRAQFTLGQTCQVTGDGAIVSVDDAATRLWTAAIPPHQTRTFDTTIRVETGTTLYVVVEPGADSNCDATTLALRISTP